MSTVVIPPPPLRLYPGPVVCWPIAALFAVFAGWGFATGRGALSPGFYWFVAICAALTFLLAVGSTIRRMQLRLTMSLRELGVTIVTGRREQTLAYEDLDALTVSESGRYDDERNLIALNRAITLHAKGKRASASYVAVANDPLDPLLQQLVERMARVRRNRSGAGWTIDHDTLIAQGHPIPLGSITSAGVYDRHVRIWQRGRTEPVLDVPLSSRNARLLLHIATQPRAALAAAPASPRGVAESSGTNHLFTRRTSKLAVLFCSAVLATVIWVARYAVVKKLPEFASLAETAALLGWALTICSAIYLMTRTYRIHERAITVATLFGSRTFTYDDAVAMTWRERAVHISEGLRIGTNMKVTLTPAAGAKPFVMKLFRYRATDEDLLPLRNAIAERIAAQMHQHLQRGEEIAWTRNSTFTPAGVVVNAGLFGGVREVVAYGQPINAMFSGGYLILCRQSWTWSDPLATIEAAQENFYPGLALFQRLVAVQWYSKS